VPTTRPRWRTLMVAVGDHDTSARPLLEKAVRLAEHFRARLRVVHVAAPTYAFVPDDLSSQAEHLEQTVARALRRHAHAGNGRDDIDVETTVVRDYPPADALVRQVLKHRPDLLIAESHRRGRLSRALLAQTDWELIRNCPCPLWLSKSDQLAEGCILAAIDPFHARAKPARLDDIILRAALTVAGTEPERVIAFHAYTPPSLVVPAMTPDLYWQPLSEKETRRYEARVRQAVERKLSAYPIPKRNRLAVPGDAARELAQIAKLRDVSLIVMGAVSRSAVKRFFIGNTAERVIDAVSCDVLVVKPAGFRTPVSRRTLRSVLGYPAVPLTGRAVTRHMHS
jgi:universal stress protein E